MYSLSNQNGNGATRYSQINSQFADSEQTSDTISCKAIVVPAESVALASKFKIYLATPSLSSSVDGG
jgi:hypothetical protein